MQPGCRHHVPSFSTTTPPSSMCKPGGNFSRDTTETSHFPKAALLFPCSPRKRSRLLQGEHSLEHQAVTGTHISAAAWSFSPCSVALLALQRWSWPRPQSARGLQATATHSRTMAHFEGHATNRNEEPLLLSLESSWS